MKSCAVVLSALFLSTCALAADDAVTLVAEGQPAAAVIVSSPQSAPPAAIFTAMIERISGAKLPVVADYDPAQVAVVDGRLKFPEGKAPFSAFVVIGDGALSRKLGVTPEGLGPGGIAIKTLPNALVLLGADDGRPNDGAGTLHAVTTFLEDSLGVRYLWPGETGLVAPPRRTVRAAPLDLRYSPSVRQRQIRFMAYHDRVQIGLDRLGLTKEDHERTMKKATGAAPQQPSWGAWQRLGGTLGLAGGHAFAYMWDKYSKDHPEWFAMQLNGSRDQSKLSPDRSRLCKSNMELVDAVARDKLEELAKTGRGSVSVSPNDGGRAGFCVCHNCKQLDAPDGPKITLWDFSTGAQKSYEAVSLTDRMVHFWNGIAERVCKERPETLLTTYAYSAYVSPPVREKLHPNIVIGFVGFDYLRDKSRADGKANWDAWAKMARKMFWRPNLLLAGRREGLPAIYVHKMAEDVRYLTRNGLVATDFDSCCHNWAVQGLNYYVLARLLWNAEVNVDEIIDDYCRAGFGAAAPQVKRYLARIEELTNRTAAEEVSLSTPYTPEVIAELRGILDVAAKAEPEPAAQRRLAMLRAGLEFTDLQSQCYAWYDRNEKADLTKEEKAAFLALMDRKWALMRRIFKEEPLAVNVAYVCWGGEARFGKMGWSKPSPAVRAKVDADEHGRPEEMLK